jgi:hypothetical protein
MILRVSRKNVFGCLLEKLFGWLKKVVERRIKYFT